MPPADSGLNGDAWPDELHGGAETTLRRVRTGVAALREENRLLRAELARLQRDSRLGDHNQVALFADTKAPGAARTFLEMCAGELLPDRLLSDARLVVTELVTNSLVHGCLDGRDAVVVRIRIDADSLRLEVVNPGVAGEIVETNGGSPDRGRGYGLALVTRLSTAWGVLRSEDTRVWVEMARA